MDSPTAYPDSPLEQEDTAYPCKGCGEILEEGKAFELAGNRWHIDCFRCNTCSTLLDSDANLLLLGDGSLICNKCTYSCSSCNNKIEDLAILTGDHAYCANCFKCRNCKKKIENLRYARTSQGIFCMDCHEALMARRRKKTARNAAQPSKMGGPSAAQRKMAGPGALLDKLLPSLPQEQRSSFSPDLDTPPSETHSETPTELPARLRPATDRRVSSRAGSSERREASPATTGNIPRESLGIPAMLNQRRDSSISERSTDEGGGEEFLIPLAFDPTPPAQQSPYTARRERDYFSTPRTAEFNTPKAPNGNANPNSPAHIAYQDRGRVPSDDSNKRRKEGSASASGSGSGSRTNSPHLGPINPQYATAPRDRETSRSMSAEEKFKLQEVPKAKRSGGSARSSKSTPTSPPLAGLSAFPAPNHGLDRSNDMLASNNSCLVQEPDSFVKTSPRLSQENRQREEGSIDSARSPQLSSIAHLQYPPKRGDSLESSKLSQTIPRKEVGSAVSSARQSPRATHGPFSATAAPAMPSESNIASDKPSAGRLASSIAESPKVRSASDALSQRKGDVVAAGLNGTAGGAEISQSRDTPNQSQPGPKTTSPNLPRWSAGGEFSMEEDMARILGGDDPLGQESFLRRMSMSVRHSSGRHNRSFSDKGIRLSKEPKWPQSPNANSLTGPEISSPSAASPNQRDELARVKSELRRERQRAVGRDQKITELESALQSNTNIKQVNSELREKRSTMVVLDTQKEMVVRELEVLTDHIAAAKTSGDPLDLSKMNHSVLRDFAESLQRLKDTFSPQIEDLVQKRNDLVEELSSLTQMKDKSFQEFEQLSMKNAQLADLNNQLVHQIQELYKANTHAEQPPAAAQSRAPNGLGIYGHHKDKSQISIESRDNRRDVHEAASLVGSGTTLQDEAEPVTVLQGPQVVSIRKGQQPKKFNWKKGGHNVAKGVTKGIKGAFSSSQASYSREMQFAETMPYGSTPPGHPPSNNNINEHTPQSQRFGSSDPGRAGFGLFGGNQKYAVKMKEPWRAQSNGSSPALTMDASTALFGSELEARVEVEKSPIPYIVTRCIEEVELRGMDAEGIYRKAGGASQVQTIKDGFEAQSPQGYDISDPDLDIHAVSSALKQYFRKLPNPLITYEIYDHLLETTMIPDREMRIDAASRALLDLPKTHREVLEFLIQHLRRVVAMEKENLMTTMNVAVVFAPTIMRPESVTREMTDTQVKNEAIQFLVEHGQAIFAGIQRRLS